MGSHLFPSSWVHPQRMFFIRKWHPCSRTSTDRIPYQIQKSRSVWNFISQICFFILSFTKEVIQKSNYNIFYVKIKPEFPQYSPFYLEILLKERKNRNKIIFYYTYGLSWEKKQKKWVNVKNGLFITFKLFLIIKSFIII